MSLIISYPLRRAGSGSAERRRKRTDVDRAAAGSALSHSYSNIK